MRNELWPGRSPRIDRSINSLESLSTVITGKDLVAVLVLVVAVVVALTLETHFTFVAEEQKIVFFGPVFVPRENNNAKRGD